MWRDGGKFRLSKAFGTSNILGRSATTRSRTRLPHGLRGYQVLTVPTLSAGGDFGSFREGQRWTRELIFDRRMSAWLPMRNFHVAPGGVDERTESQNRNELVGGCASHEDAPISCNSPGEIALTGEPRTKKNGIRFPAVRVLRGERAVHAAGEARAKSTDRSCPGQGGDKTISAAKRKMER